MSRMSYPFPSYFNLVFVISRLMSTMGKLKPWTNLLPSELLSLDISKRLRVDSDATNSAASDFGRLIHASPAAILHPSSIDDIVSLVKFSYTLSVPFGIAARGRGHSIRGQALAENGVVIDMSFLMNDNGSNSSSTRSNRIRICEGRKYVDVGGEQLWIDVLRATLEHGVAPASWTDYLYLTVGGTLSNAGISGQTFRHGPQISIVQELDVITGKGEVVQCSKHVNSELFHAVLGGLGQFGIISRARIALQPAPKRVKWVRMLYDDFSTFTRDQERLILIHGDMDGIFNGLNYLEGSLIMQQSTPNNWRSSFFSPSDQSQITSLVTPNGIIYCLEVVKYYDDSNMDTIDEELQKILEDLNFLLGFDFIKDVTYIDFLNRVRKGELELESKGLWDVPHPWLNLFIPQSQISKFNSEIFTKVLTKQTIGIGPYLVYPMLQNKWDNRMSAVIPEEDVFYTIGLLHSSGFDDWEVLEDQNKEILRLCQEKGIKVKQYLPHYVTKEEWKSHFGSKWERFLEHKIMFDPKMILSPGQRIFN
ncbi:Cytokinin dehydrogenase [Ancistrocladus abbreviatus]